jgi:hypothetical protein
MIREEFKILPDPITFQKQLAKEQRRREVAFGIMIILFAIGLFVTKIIK